MESERIDVIITSSAGGASSLRIEGEHEISTDSREQASEFFLVVPDMGGIATVHKVDSNDPTPAFLDTDLPPEG